MISASSAWPPEGFREYRPADRELFDYCVGPVYCTRSAPNGVKAFTLRVQPQVENLHGVVHGGALMTIVDSMMGYLLKEKLDGKSCATISLTADFLGAVRIGDLLSGEATLLRLGRMVAFTRSNIFRGDSLILAASAKWAITQGAR